MPTQVTPQILSAYIKEGKRHKHYSFTVDLMSKVKVHADGLMPRDLIDKRRPNEDEVNKQYRKDIYIPITKEVFSRVLNALMKIRKSPDWMLKFDNDIPKSIAGGESLKDYLQTTFPYFQSVTNYAFEVLLKNILLDSNAVCVVMPLNPLATEGEFLQPFPFLYSSDQVLEYKVNDYCIIGSDDKTYYVVTTYAIEKWERDTDGRVSNTMNYLHGLGELPAFKLGGVLLKADETDFIYDSLISPIIPRLDEAAREYSDLQIDVVLNIHSEKWQYAAQECKSCRGSGMVKKGEKSVKCGDCKGEGSLLSSPFNRILVKPPVGSELPTPIPPGGYIEKQPELITIQDLRIKDHLFSAYKAINLHYLDSTLLNQSGVAKNIDKDEVYTYYNQVGEVLVRCLDRMIYFINEIRYGTLIAEKKVRRLMLPSIPVPERFDILSSTMLIDEISKAKLAGINMVLIASMEAEYAAKKFIHDPTIKEVLESVILLDPLFGVSQDNKTQMLADNGISEQDYLISSNIYEFVKEALQENKDFNNLPYDTKKEVIQSKAAEKRLEIGSAVKVMSILEKK